MTNRSRAWLALAALVGLAGCGDDFTNPGGVTLIEGQVAETGSGFPVFDLGIALEFTTETVSAPGVLGPAQLATAVLDVPYPSPVTFEDSIRVVLSTDQLVPVRVWVEADSRALPGAIATLADGMLTSTRTTYVWDLRDEFGGAHVPNGIYYFRVVVDQPDDLDDELEQAFLVNRPPNQAIVLDAFHAYSDPDGRYRIADVPTGLSFTATSSTGAVLGQRRVREDMTLFFCDIDYRLQLLDVTVPARAQVGFDFFVQPRVPVAPEYPTIE